ncbi:LysR family transcriptional regulator [Vagococcus zengguangii]|uniref:LysR family transcriptional regulator n=1 Tax=Vagococcus zengguangii TaxID=2571750 RepID=A0A4D7CSE9_9ENTE|nr:LysR family transcriptional regulator [Vagococcus zengguangii]QCI85814.1 LysR family transcriptional regulator [Vagococcus zengguangii]TLG81755.1 LysR family transcriptional regulator [Vagococcus zengguangii]
MFALIDTFLAVYETRSFTKAAEQLFISQPAVSVHIKKLEQHFDVTLFTRGGNHQLIPTEQADYLYPKLQVLKQTWHQLELEAKDMPLTKQDITIALSNTHALKVFPKLLTRLLEKFPQVNFHLVETNSQSAQKMIKHYQADIGFIEDDLLDSAIKREFFYEDQLVHCGQVHSPYWLLREPSSGTYRYQNDYLKKNNLQPEFIHVNSNEMMLALLKEGIGQTVLSKLFIPTDSTIPINHVVAQRPLYLITRQNETESLVHQIKNAVLAHEK